MNKEENSKLVDLMIDQYYFKERLNEYSDQFIVNQFASVNTINIYHTMCTEYYTKIECYVLTTWLIYLLSQFNAVNGYDPVTLFNNMNALEIVDIEQIIKYHKQLVNNILIELRELFPNTYPLIRKHLTFKDHIYLYLSNKIYKSETNRLLKYVDILNQLSECKEYEPLFKLDRDHIVNKLITSAIPNFKKYCLDNIINDYTKYMFSRILDDINIVAMNDVKTISLYIYNEDDIEDATYGFMINDTYDAEIENKVRKGITIDLIMVMLLLVTQEFKYTTNIDQEIIEDNMKYLLAKKSKGFIPGNKYLRSLKEIIFILVEYIDNNKELYIMLTDTSMVRVPTGGYFKISNEYDDCLNDILSKKISTDNLIIERYNDLKSLPSIYFDGNIDNFLIEFAYYCNGYTKYYKLNYNMHKIVKYFDAHIVNGVIDNIIINKTI